MGKAFFAIRSVILLTFAISAWGGTYYIAANGSDSNNGTSMSTPWLHAPGMPNCTGTCGSHTPAAGDRFIFRGGDTWHFGNSAASPYTGGTWDLYSWWGTAATCQYEGTTSGCIYYGVDLTWFSGPSWTRPILTGDNPTSTTLVSSCAYQVASTGQYVTHTMVSMAPQSIIDNFEMTGMCSQDSTVTSGNQDVYVAYLGTGNAGSGMAFLNNVYIHGWTATLTAGTGGNNQPGTLIGGGYNGLQSIDHLVIDGSDSSPGSWAWGTFPSFYHFRDSIVRYANQGVGAWCHDIHDNIFEHFYNHNPGAGSHTNILECNDDGSGNAVAQPQNTPNVFYNNIVRHDDPSFSAGGQVHLWFCPETVPEYWFNNVVYDVGNENVWDYAGPPIYTCSGTGGQFMFNNTLVDVTQPCYVSNVNHGGKYLTISNEHLINAPLDSGSTACTGANSLTNIAMSDATATSQGYTTGLKGLSGGGNTCANELGQPCSSSSASSTLGAGANHQAYCTALAGYSSEYAIGTEAANACKYGTTDGCTYNTSTHSMVCPSQTAIARPTSAAWDTGAYQSNAQNSSSGCTATQKNWGNSPVLGFPDGGTPPASNTVSLTANIDSIGDLVAITAWCFPPTFTGGGCTPTGVKLGNQTAVMTTVPGQSDAGTSGTPGSGQGWIYYVLSAAAAGSQTLTFTTAETQQLQVSYMDFKPSAGCTFQHDVDSPRGSGNNVGASITSPSITPSQAGDLLFNFTWTSGHMVDPVGSPWVASIWQPQLSDFLANSVNLVTYVLSASSGVTANNVNTLHASDSWQALITSFKMSTSTQNPPTLPPTSVTTVVH